jgi:hypothetical protein
MHPGGDTLPVQGQPSRSARASRATCSESTSATTAWAALGPTGVVFWGCATGSPSWTADSASTARRRAAVVAAHMPFRDQLPQSDRALGVTAATNIARAPDVARAASLEAPELVMPPEPSPSTAFTRLLANID